MMQRISIEGVLNMNMHKSTMHKMHGQGVRTLMCIPEREIRGTFLLHQNH